MIQRAPLALVVLSGGQDSTTCLALAIRDYGRERVYALTIDYMQRHRVEVDAAERVVSAAGMNLITQHEILRVSPHLLKGSSPLLTGGPAVEQYESADVLPGGLEKTFVPMRNQFFLTIALNRAVVLAMKQSINAVDLFTGVSQEDYGGYPDCRFAFIDMLEKTAQLSLDAPELPRVRILAPLMFLDKTNTVKLAQQLPGCMRMLSYSHTCYNGKVPPCGKCHACLLRQRGFDNAGVVDPLLDRLGVVPSSESAGRPGGQ